MCIFDFGVNCPFKEQTEQKPKSKQREASLSVGARECSLLSFYHGDMGREEPAGASLFNWPGMKRKGSGLETDGRIKTSKTSSLSP